MKKHIAELLGYPDARHSHFDFIDINVLDDQKLFIDPCLIETINDDWCRDAASIINDFFNHFYEAYRSNDYNKKLILLSHANEVNFTKLGYGNGVNGHGNTAVGLINDFRNLEGLIARIDTISKPMDLPIMVSGFNEDGLSDMITNIIHLKLNEFTLEQLALAGKQPNSEDTFYTWDNINSVWKEVTKPCYRYEEDKILLTPKRIVRKKYLFGANQFLMRVILERAKVATAYKNEKGETRYRRSKKELRRSILKENHLWKYEYTSQKAAEDPTYLDEYHRNIPLFYFEKGMSDNNLDRLIY